MRIWMWDIETTGLDPKRGDIHLLTAFAPLDDLRNPVVIGNMDVPDDYTSVLDVRDFIMEREDDMFFGWNTFKFDLPFLLKRLEVAGEWPFAHRGQRDFKDLFKAKHPYLDGHLDTALKAYGIETQKTELDLSKNLRCARSVDDIEAWTYLKEHCVADVSGMGQLFQEVYHTGYWEPQMDFAIDVAS